MRMRNIGGALDLAETIYSSHLIDEICFVALLIL
jgi:hypothetical protein